MSSHALVAVAVQPVISHLAGMTAAVLFFPFRNEHLSAPLARPLVMLPCLRTPCLVTGNAIDVDYLT